MSHGTHLATQTKKNIMAKKDFSSFVGSGETSIGTSKESPNDELIVIETDNYAPLSSQEEEEFLNYESIIEKGLQTFFEVGQALTQIRDQKLYRKDYSTFEDYCIKRWGFQRRKAYRLMEAAEVLKNVSHGTQIIFLPQNERQARELARLPAEEQQNVWMELISNDNKTPTAKMVELKVKERLGLIQPIEKPDTSESTPHVITIDQVKIKLVLSLEKYQAIQQVAQDYQMTPEEYILEVIDESLK